MGISYFNITEIITIVFYAYLKANSLTTYISHKNLTIYQIIIDHNLKIIVDKSHKKVHNILP